MAALNACVVAMLRCPLTGSPLSQDGEWFVSEVGKVRYPVVDGVPVLLADKARLPDGCGTVEEAVERLPKAEEAGEA